MTNTAATKTTTKTASTKAPAKKAWADKAPRDLHAEVADKFIAAIEAVIDGTAKALPWQRPWGAAGLSGLPINGATKRPYNGVNVALLWMSGYADRRWYTFNQAKALGAFVRKGEKSTPIVFWSFIEKEDKDTGEKKKIGFLRSFAVFNREQIDWSNSKDQDAPAPAMTQAQIDEETARAVASLEAAILAKQPVVEHGGDMACYSPSFDKINMPVRSSFRSERHYIATLAHEAAHWTGHTSRLDRKLTTRFGTDSYATEELVAELAAAFLCAEHGVATGELDEQHKSYLVSWVKVLKNDKHAVFTASKLAREAAGFFAAEQGDEDEGEGEEG